ncbi:MAG: hypothetical protein AB8C95_03220, partial [Phycisphaeraceae bacterium]
DIFINETKVDGDRLIDHIKRNKISVDALLEQLEQHRFAPLASDALNPLQMRSLMTELLAEHHYAGYIKRQEREVKRMTDQEANPLPTDLDYAEVKGLRSEAQLVLNQFKPATLGQAGRLEGVNPADLMVISVYLNKRAQTV